MWPREDIDCLVENIVKNLHNNPLLSDLIIRLKDGSTLYGHKFVLASRSKVWYNQFINIKDMSSLHAPSSPTTTSTATTTITTNINNDNIITNNQPSTSDWTEFDSEIATIMLAWIYTGELDLDNSRARDEKFIYSIMNVAKRFELAQMINQCEKILQNPPPLTPNSPQHHQQQSQQQQQQQQQQQPQQTHSSPPTQKQHSLSHLPATTRMKLSHLRAHIKRQASKAARSKLEKRSSVSGAGAASTSTTTTTTTTKHHHLMPGGQDSLHQKNFKQKLIALIKKFRTDDSDFEIEEQYREALEREIMEAAAGGGSRAIEELLEEDIEVDEESGDWDNISETSTQKPSLRPFFSSTTLDKI